MTNEMTIDRPEAKRINKTKKGISPVVATVILVAVAVVIAAALAGFSSSLFGTYSTSGSIDLTTLVVKDDGTGYMVVRNTGAKADSVVSVQVPPNVAFTDPGDGTNISLDDDGELDATGLCTAATDPAPVIKANSQALICIETADSLFSGDPLIDGHMPSGQQITIKIIMKSGVELTRSVTVSPLT